MDVGILAKPHYFLLRALFFFSIFSCEIGGATQQTATLVTSRVKDSEAYEAVASNTSGSTPKDLFEDLTEELEKKVLRPIFARPNSAYIACVNTLYTSSSYHCLTTCFPYIGFTIIFRH